MRNARLAVGQDENPKKTYSLFQKKSYSQTALITWPVGIGQVLIASTLRVFSFFKIGEGAWVASEAQPPEIQGFHSLALFEVALFLAEAAQNEHDAQASALVRLSRQGSFDLREQNGCIRLRVVLVFYGYVLCDKPTVQPRFRLKEHNFKTCVSG